MRGILIRLLLTALAAAGVTALAHGRRRTPTAPSAGRPTRRRVSA